MITNGYSAYYAYLNRAGVVCPAGYHVENQALAHLPKKNPWNGGFSLVFRPLAGTAFPLQETFSPAPQPACRGRRGIPRFCVLRRVLRVFSVFPVFLGLGRSGIVGEFPCPGAGVFSWSARFFLPGGCVSCLSFG